MSKALIIPELSAAEKRRFWSKVEKREDGCWIWTACTVVDRRGARYGRVWIRRHLYLAHRVAWSISHGRIPDGLQLDHRCHNTLCVNTAHLHVVTNQENGENHLGPNSSKFDCPHSGCRGVTWNRGRWMVLVHHSGRCHFGGRYTDVNESSLS